VFVHLLTATRLSAQKQMLLPRAKVVYRLSVRDPERIRDGSGSLTMSSSARSNDVPLNRLRTSVFTLERYVTEVLMRDLVAHDHLSSAFLIYLFLRGRATADQSHERSARRRMHPVTISVRELAAETGLAKSVVQTALKVLQRRELLRVHSRERTGQPARAASYQVLRPWRKPVPRKEVN
jgi:hypothetical protein